jgi:hypothetical protein
VTASVPAGTDPLSTGPPTISGEKHSVMHGRTIGIWENVKAWGAKGDDSTDDTAAVQACIDAVGDATGGIVYFPPGTYRTTSVLTVDQSNIWLMGSGVTACHIFLDNATAVAVIADGSGVGGISNFALTDMTISCFLKPGLTRTAGKGLEIHNVGTVRVENVAINHGWDSLYLNQCYSGIFRNVVIDEDAVAIGGTSTGVFIANSISNLFDGVTVGCDTSTGVTGWDINGGVDTLMMRGCGVQGTSNFLYGIRTRNSVGASDPPQWVRISDTFIEVDDATGVGIALGACRDVEFNDCYVKGGAVGIDNTGSARHIRFHGGIVQLAQTYGVLLDAADGFDMEGTLVTDNGQAANNTYAGIIVAGGCTNFSFRGVRSGNLLWNGSGGYGAYQKYGIQIDFGASTNYSIVDCDLRNNVTAGLLDNGTGTTTRRVLTDYLQLSERADPAAPPANDARMYVRDNGSGKTQIVAVFNTGAVQVIATEP